MPLIDWSMTILGYREHQRSGAAVVGTSHTSLHTALRFAEGAGWYTGWIATDGPSPQIELVDTSAPEWVALAELFVEGRVANTEGIVGGGVIFVPTVPADGQPPADRSLIAWAEERGRPWLEVHDNETAYWGGLDEAGRERLLAWFLCRRPVELEWTETKLEPAALRVLDGGLFEHGWTRNLSLVSDGWRIKVPLWAGINGRSMLEHDRQLCQLSTSNRGSLLILKGSRWAIGAIDGDCPLDDETGRTVPRL